MKMKICFVIGEFNIFSGTSKPMFELAKRLLNEGHDVTIISSKLKSNLKDSHDLFFESNPDSCLKIIEVPTTVYNFTIRGYKKNQKIIDILSDADIIHGFNFIELYLIKRLMNKLNIKTKTICTISGPYKFHFKDLWDSGILSFLNILKPAFIFKLIMPNMILKKIFNQFDNIITNSLFITTEIESIGINSKKIKKIEASLDIDKIDHYNRLDLKKEYDFLYYGSGSSIRGIQDALKAFEILLKEKPNSTLAFYLLGSHGIEERIYAHIIRSNKNFGSSIFLNVGAKLDILEIVKSSNAVVLPFRSSIGYSHPPLTIIESMLLEKMIITTNVGSIPEFVQENITGFLVSKGNVKKIAENMKLSYNSDKRLKIGKNARQSIINSNKNENIIKKTMNVYKSVMSE